jgi:hypothetical protein
MGALFRNECGICVTVQGLRRIIQKMMNFGGTGPLRKHRSGGIHPQLL